MPHTYAPALVLSALVMSQWGLCAIGLETR
jgi:hypothetical protein